MKEGDKENAFSRKKRGEKNIPNGEPVWEKLPVKVRDSRKERRKGRDFPRI